MDYENDLRRVEEHVAEARCMVRRQSGLIIRLRTAGVSTLDARRKPWLLESNLRYWRNTGTAFGQASLASKQSDARHCW